MTMLRIPIPRGLILRSNSRADTGQSGCFSATRRWKCPPAAGIGYASRWDFGADGITRERSINLRARIFRRVSVAVVSHAEERNGKRELLRARADQSL